MTTSTPSPAIAAPSPEGAEFVRGLLSSAILLLIIRMAEPLFFGTGHFAGLAFHPFWIVILLAAMQDGLFVGVATAGLATLMMDWPPRPVGADITAHYLELAATPTQWLIVALIIGLFRQAQLRQMRHLRDEAARMARINETLAAEIHRLDAALAQAELIAATAIPEGDEAGPDAAGPGGAGCLAKTDVQPGESTPQDV